MFSFDAQKYKWFNLQLKIYYKINAVFLFSKVCDLAVFYYLCNL